MTSVPKIRCAKCDKLVDDVYWSQDNWTHVITIKVRCHGETDEMELDIDKLSFDEVKQLDRSEGLAFTRDRLELVK